MAAIWLSQALGAQDEGNWPRWRGPSDIGSTAQGHYPVKWSGTNVLWKTPLPGKGCSTPVVWAKTIFLTAPADGNDAALAFDWNGKLLWQATFEKGETGKRQNSSGCNPSAATDGQSVFVYFKSGTLAALDFAGKVKWRTNLVAGFGPESLFWDQGTSPALTRDTVIIARMHHGDSWLAAFEKNDGRLRWKVPRNYETAVEGDNSYTTPLVIERQGKELILAWGGEHLTVNAATGGQLLWSCDGFNPQATGYWPTVASPVMADDIVIVPSGRADRGQPRLHGIRLAGTDGVSSSARVWQRQDVGTFVPTPVAYGGRVYLLQDRGEIQCLDPLTGKTLWRDNLPKSSKSYFASPLIAAGKLYATREDGVIFVAQVENTFSLVAENPMGEQIIASPVPVANRLLIRGDHHLFCIE